MKNLKKIISVFVLCMMLLSLGICSASETESDFGIIETNGTSKSVYVEFNEPVSLDSEQIQFSLSDENGNDIAISKTVLSDDKKRVNIIFENPITVFANETKKVNIKVHNISNEDSTKIYIGGEASVTYTGIYFDNFDNYTDIAELDNEFQIVGNYNWATQKFQNCPNNFSFEDDDNGGKKLKITGMAPVWGIQHKYATNWNQNKKNYTVEVDMQSSTEDNKRFGFCINQYDLGYGGIISVTFKKQLIDFSTGGNRLMQDVALENVAITSDEKYSVAMSMKPSCDQTADIMDIYYNGENKAHAKGTVKLSSTGHGMYHFMIFEYNTAYMDNFKLYTTASEVNNASAKILEISDINAKIEGEFDENQTIVCEHLPLNLTGFDVNYTYKWLKSDDPDKDFSEWTEVENANEDKKTFTLTSENCNFDVDNYLCEVTVDISQTDGDFQKTLVYRTDSACKPWAPICQKIDFKYEKTENSASLEAVPEYYDINRDEEDKENAEFKWQISDDKTNWSDFDGTVSDINNYKGNLIDVTDVTEKFVKCKVTLKSKLNAKESNANTLIAEAKEESYTLPFKPVAKNVSVSGSTTIGSVLKGTYEYYDENGDIEDENATEKVWYRRKNSSYTQIGTGLNYSITNADAGYEIVFKVTPKNSVYPETGDTAESSNSISVKKSSNNSGGSSSGGSSGGSYSSNTTVSTKPSDDTTKFTPIPKEKEPAFPDIKGHWAEATIEKLNEKGLVNGKGSGFEPESTLTRAEWITLLLRGIGADFSNTKSNTDFSDVKADDWYAKAVWFAYENKLVNGDDGKFDPNANITREQMAKMLVDVMEYYTKEEITEAELLFNDSADISDWASEYVKKAVREKLISGTPENNFNPKSNATRAEASTVLLRLLNAVGK